MSKKQIKANLIPVVLYIRMSSSAQEASPDQQRSECRKLCEQHGYYIVREYFDSAISGAGAVTKRRTQFLKMIQDADKRHDFLFIVCWDQDRFGRFPPQEANHYWHLLDEAGVKLHTVAQGIIQTDDLGDWLQASITQHGKAQFLVDLSRNVLRGKRECVANGQPVSQAAYGYDRVYRDAAGEVCYRCRYNETFRKPRAWSVQFQPSDDTEAVETVWALFQRFDTSDVSIGTLARDLNENGVPSPKDRRWGKQSIRYMLSNRVYLGDLLLGKVMSGKFHQLNDDGEICVTDKPQDGDSVRRNRDADVPIVIADTHPALIDREQFNRVQQKLARNKVTNNKGSADGYLLTGILRCGHCGSAMYMMIYKGESRYYSCNGGQKGICKTRSIHAVDLGEKIFCAEYGGDHRSVQHPRTNSRCRGRSGRQHDT